MRPFHLAITTNDLGATERFYAGLLGAGIGRRAARWIDFDLFGHQVSVHLDEAKTTGDAYNPVDGDRVPVPHFGVVLDMEAWRVLGDRLTAAGVEFVIPPRVRFAGEVGEQGTFFLKDPAGNALEFKAFQDLSSLFAT
ncbi:MAG: VOC family protein [Planctomycetota bacterium]